MAKELLLELGVADARERAVVVPRGAVRLQLHGQIANVQRQSFDHEAAHLVIPNVLWSVKIAEEDFGKLVGAQLLEAAHHGVRQDEGEVRAGGEAAVVRLLVAVDLRRAHTGGHPYP